MGVAYDASAGIIVTALRIASTIIPLVIDGPEFWVLLVFNSVICFARHLDLIDPEAYHLDLPWGLTGVTGSLMTFFVCFYNSHVFSRYNHLYDLTKAMEENTLELVSVLRLQIEDKRLVRKVSKLVLSSCFMFFFERTQSDCEEGNVSIREYQQLETLELLDCEEVSAIKKYCKRL